VAPRGSLVAVDSQGLNRISTISFTVFFIKTHNSVLLVTATLHPHTAEVMETPSPLGLSYSKTNPKNVFNQ
jgi:hypothetical protein